MKNVMSNLARRDSNKPPTTAWPKRSDNVRSLIAMRFFHNQSAGLAASCRFHMQHSRELAGL